MNTKMLLVDAQKRHEQEPETFEVPTATELSKLKAGDCVKVIAPLKDRGPRYPTGERFWVLLHKFLGNGVWVGEVNSHVIALGKTKAGDEIRIHTDNVIDIWSPA